MKKYFLVILVLVLLTGCNGKKEESAKIKMSCNKEETTHTVKEGDVLSCKLLGDEYKVTISSVSKDTIKIKVNTYGLTDSHSLLEKKDEFEFSKDKALNLTTQTTDYSESLKLSYES